jgi:hypothetical protein
MILRKAFFWFCLTASFACLAGGFAMVGQWMGAGAVLAPTIAGLFSTRFRVAWLAFACLVSFVGLAAVGLLEGAPAFLMILGATAALAGWDLHHFDRSMEGSAPSETARQYEGYHLRSLALALGFGLLIAVAGALFSLRIPFVFLIVLVLLDLFSLDRVFRYLKNRRSLNS